MLQTPVSLLERLCRDPDEQHWERFVTLFAPLLSRWARRLGVPAADIEDLLQEIFTQLLRILPGFRYDPKKSFRAWLWTVFHRYVLAWRKQQGRPLALTLEQLEALVSPDSVAEATEAEYRRVLLDRVLRLVRTDFPERTWQLFWAVAVEGRSGVEVARQYGVTAWSCIRFAGVRPHLAQSIDEPVTDPKNFGSWHPGVCQFVFFDGSVRPVKNSTPGTTLSLLARPSDGQAVPDY